MNCFKVLFALVLVCVVTSKGNAKEPCTSPPPGSEMLAAGFTEAGLKTACTTKTEICKSFTVDPGSCSKYAPKKLTPDESATTSEDDPDYAGEAGIYKALGDAGALAKSCLASHGLSMIYNRYAGALKPKSLTISCPEKIDGDYPGVTYASGNIEVNLSIMSGSASHLSMRSILFHESFHSADFHHAGLSAPNSPNAGVDYPYLATRCCVEKWMPDTTEACRMLNLAATHIEDVNWWLSEEYLSNFSTFVKPLVSSDVFENLMKAANANSAKTKMAICMGMKSYYGVDGEGSIVQTKMTIDMKNIAQTSGCLNMNFH